MDFKKEVSLTTEATLYSKPGCQQCRATERKLDSEGIKYTYVDVSASAPALATIKDLGYLQAPVVVTASGEHWSGYRPDLIEQHLV